MTNEDRIRQVMEYLRDIPRNLETDDVTFSVRWRDWCVRELASLLPTVGDVASRQR